MRTSLVHWVTWCALAQTAGFATEAADRIPSGSAGDVVQVSWWAAPDTRVWTASVGREGSAAGPPLVAPRWFSPVPELRFEGFDGKSRPLDNYAGRVLVLDFWATWCEPCRVQLPRMQQLAEVMNPEDVEVIAVNMGESAGVARPYAESLGLRMPVVRYSESMRRTLEIRTLPTTIVIDRWGRIRLRRDGYRGGLEQEIARRVRELVDEQAAPGEEVAQVVAGGGSFEVGWSREFAADVSALAALGAGPETRGVLAVAGRELLVLGEDGRTIARHRNARGVGLLLSGDLDGDGRPETVGYRPGAAGLATLDLTDGRHAPWAAAEPVLDAAVVPARSPGSQGYLLLETKGGLHRVHETGEPVAEPVEVGGFWDLVVAGREGEVRPVLLERGVRLHWMSSALEPAGSTPVAETARTLVAAGPAAEGVGVTSAPFAVAAAGRWLEVASEQLALALPGRLLVLDLSSGNALFHARWPEITDVCVTDLDGDGNPELAVASGRRATLLRSSARVR